MNNYPKNKSEKTAFPIKIFSIVLIFVVAALLILTKTIFFKGDNSNIPTNITPLDGIPANFVPKAFIDLHGYYNGSLKTNWMDVSKRMQDRNLSDLPTNVNVFNGSTFRVAGLVQLQGSVLKHSRPGYPEQVGGIPVRMKCSELHFLQGTGWTVTDGAQIGAYIIHFDDGSHVEFPIFYGADVRDWCYYSYDANQATNAAWSSQLHPVRFRLYAATWHNPKPDMPVKSLDYISLVTGCAPFLVAITVE